MSAKVRVPFLRQVVPISKKVRKRQEEMSQGRLNSSFILFFFSPKVARDPRFDDLSGEYNPEVFDKTYEFLNDIRAKEKEVWNMRLAHGDCEGWETRVQVRESGRGEQGA